MFLGNSANRLLPPPHASQTTLLPVRTETIPALETGKANSIAVHSPEMARFNTFNSFFACLLQRLKFLIRNRWLSPVGKNSRYGPGASSPPIESRSPIIKSSLPRMARRYSHNGQTAQREAVNALRGADFEGDGAQNWAQSQKPRVRQLAN